MHDDQPALQPLPWLPVLETGHEEIDQQHRALIHDANEVIALVINGTDWGKLVAAMGRMHRDCALHFADEEKLLATSGYGEAAAHALEHQRLLEQIAQIDGLMRAASAPTRFDWERALTVRSLLLDHFLRYDLLYKSHIMFHQPRRP